MPEDKLKKINVQLRALTTYIHNAREEERKRIAREIHDELGQSLMVIQMDLQRLVNSLEEQKQTLSPALKVDTLVKELKNMDVIVNKSVEAVNTIITELRPVVLENLGLIDAIKNQATNFNKRLGIKTVVDIKVETVDLPDNSLIESFRIVQEAMTNIAKHAKASKVNINIYRIDSSYVLEVVDDGVGIDLKTAKDKKSFGLIGMRERAYSIGADIKIEKIRTGGTRVRVIIPFDRKRIN